MKLDLLKEKKEAVSMALIWLTVVSAVLIVFKVGGFFVSTVKAGRLMERAVAQSRTDANDMEKYFAKSKSTAEDLKEKNLFYPPVKKKHPVKGVSGILGKEALINGKLYKVGDTVSDAKIKIIEPTYVIIEWEGKEKTFSPFDLKSAETLKKKTKKMKKKETPERRIESQPRQRRGRRGRRGMFQNLSDEERAELREKMRNMSREERREYFQQRRQEGD